MIIDKKTLSISESVEYLQEKTEKNEELKAFIKKFEVIEEKKAKELREKLQNLGLMKLKSEQTVKIIDLMPDNNEDLNKIFADVTLDENETKQILDTIKEYK